MLQLIDEMSVTPLIFAAIFMALAPFQPEPHLVEKFRMLKNGLLVKPIDIFDLFFHLIPAALLAFKLIRQYMIK
jgi:hypothetical protein